MIYFVYVLLFYLIIGYSLSIYIFGTNKQSKWSYSNFIKQFNEKENRSIYNILAWVWLFIIVSSFFSHITYQLKKKRKGQNLWK